MKENASDGKTALTNKGYYETAPDAANVATEHPAMNSANYAAKEANTLCRNASPLLQSDDTKAECVDRQ